MEDLKYPVGKFSLPTEITPSQITEWISIIQQFPNQLKGEIESMTEDQLNESYRPGGWKVKQVVHHCVDSHMNSVVRFKLALTEDNPIIKTYEEDKWAQLVDSTEYPVSQSLILLQAIHERWVFLLKSLNTSQLALTYLNPESKREFRLDQAIGLYAWHCRHHLAHVRLVSQQS